MNKESLTFFNTISKLVTSHEFSSKDVRSASHECLHEVYILMQEKLKTDLSLEIGAHAAEFSLCLKEKYKDAISVCAVEGSPKTHKHFSDTIDFKSRGVEYMNVVLSEKNDYVTFYEYSHPEGDNASAQISSIHLRDTERAEGKGRKQKVSVKSIRGDSLLENKFPDKQCVSLWIDVEGAQAEVLSSFNTSFRSGKINSLFVEVEAKKLWPSQLMLDTDIITHLSQFGFVPFLRDNEYGVQYNIIFIKKDLIKTSFSKFYNLYTALLLENIKGIYNV